MRREWNSTHCGSRTPWIRSSSIGTIRTSSSAPSKLPPSEKVIQHGTVSACTSGNSWSWRGPGGRSSTPSPSAPFLLSCGTSGTAWKTKASRCSCWSAGRSSGREQGVDQALQTAMLRDAFDYNGNPGIAVLLTGDGSGFADGVGFHADMQRMRSRGWRVEVISWRHSCNRRMREWAEEEGVFIALDDFYDSVTFLEPPAPGQPIASPRFERPLDFAKRPVPE